MTLFSRPLRLSLTAALVLPALLAGCASEQQPTHFAPLRYDYLSQMNLNVSTLSVVDNTVTNPVPGDIGARAPTPPFRRYARWFRIGWPQPATTAAPPSS